MISRSTRFGSKQLDDGAVEIDHDADTIFCFLTSFITTHDWSTSCLSYRNMVSTQTVLFLITSQLCLIMHKIPQ